MSDWSSFEEDKRITDAWRSYLKEDLADVMSGYVGGIKNTTDDETEPEPEPTKGPKGTFYRNILAEVTVLISNIANRIGVQIDTEIVVEEFEKMITDQNFELAEQVSAGKAFTGEGTPLNFLPEGHPELTKFIVAVKPSKYLKNFAQSLARAGFGGDSIKAVLGKPAPDDAPAPDGAPPEEGEGEKPYPTKEKPYESNPYFEAGLKASAGKSVEDVKRVIEVAEKDMGEGAGIAPGSNTITRIDVTEEAKQNLKLYIAGLKKGIAATSGEKEPEAITTAPKVSMQRQSRGQGIELTAAFSKINKVAGNEVALQLLKKIRD